MSAITISQVTIRSINGLYSLNDLHKASGSLDKHSPRRWLQNKQTTELISKIEIDGIPSIVKKQGLGTFVCKELVIHYGMWINPEFSLRVIRSFLISQESVQSDYKLNEHQKQQIKEAVNRRHHRTKESHQAIYLKLHALCKVSTYTEINASDFEMAMSFLNSIENSPVTSCGNFESPVGQHLITDDDIFQIAYNAACIHKMGKLFTYLLPAFERLNSRMEGDIAEYAQCCDNRHYSLIQMAKRHYDDCSELTKTKLDWVMLQLS
ncbi:KilA-N domain-containing protein [Vitreoscilla massiliensis]|uniref:KilA-N domain-containing protein n=1 Tax=Vitreoscilla massiliensis TaxID=1689272 RepID=A0ABY4E741_9NEIS|nr:KilA-N domain-containing protein [Vitreoscilla massiliensis]UOO89187.1 KilA-N domain-containing protein [Vitreoscilla massiliensis]